MQDFVRNVVFLLLAQILKLNKEPIIKRKTSSRKITNKDIVNNNRTTIRKEVLLMSVMRKALNHPQAKPLYNVTFPFPFYFLLLPAISIPSIG